MASPYEIVFGDALEGLHPRLRRYFGAIPEGCVGRGDGVFQRVGTPRRLLWPVVRVLSRQGIVFAAWERDVPFTVVNRPVVDADGHVAVAARRLFFFESGTRSMVDAITAGPDGLVDVLGIGRRLTATLRADVDDTGALVMTSAGVSAEVGRVRLRLPAVVSPRVRLRESFDDDLDHQVVSLTLSLPVIGRLYEYSGTFDYTIGEAEAL